jgi:hypothetical protein
VNNIAIRRATEELEVASDFAQVGRILKRHSRETTSMLLNFDFKMTGPRTRGIADFESSLIKRRLATGPNPGFTLRAICLAHGVCVLTWWRQTIGGRDR